MRSHIKQAVSTLAHLQNQIEHARDLIRQAIYLAPAEVEPDNPLLDVLAKLQCIIDQ